MCDAVNRPLDLIVVYLVERAFIGQRPPRTVQSCDRPKRGQIHRNGCKLHSVRRIGGRQRNRVRFVGEEIAGQRHE